MNKGFLSIILHAHLPYVHHPEYERFFEENWLFEAMTDCYLPLVSMLDRLQSDSVNYRLTLSISPTLLSMWRNPLLQSRYQAYLLAQLELAEKEIQRTRHQTEINKLAEMYEQRFRNILNIYRDKYQCDLLSAFIKHQQTGKLALITTAATHGFLPLLNLSEASVRTQIKVGLNTFQDATGIQSKGFWLPECGYYPGLEKILQEYGVKYFFVETHGIMNAKPLSKSGVYTPVVCDNGVAAFGRDPASSSQVWNAQHGYPGDADYREYYRDIGFDLDQEYLAPYLVDGKTRCNTGIKYHRITGKGQTKEIYNPEAALNKVRQHAEHFITERRLQLAALNMEMDQSEPIIVAPFDAELFGHWWFEGPNWLEMVLRLANDADAGLKTCTCPEYLEIQQGLQTTKLFASSWGEQGNSAYWLNESNDWIYPLIHKAANELEKLVADLQGKTVNTLQQRALNQAVRSLLLAQASDWSFILKSGTSVDFAKQNITEHLARFNYLYDSIRKNRLNERYLTALEIMDNIFPDLDFREFKADF
jgi:1,4-alpha-glucan branching enzyme